MRRPNRQPFLFVCFGYRKRDSRGYLFRAIK
nr:MAG TPA: hypothetical protein [Caudoviricetes sp.]